MSARRISMRKLKELFKLKFEHGLSNRQIGRSCNMSHSTVSVYLNRFEAAGLSWPLKPDMTEELLYEKLLFKDTRQEHNGKKPLPDFKEMFEELKGHKGMTLLLLWKEYKESYPHGYGYSQFCEKYRDWRKKLTVSMRQQHKGGEKMFADYAGLTVDIVSPVTGKSQPSYIFVIVLGASNYTYAEAHIKKDVKNWIGGHVRAFKYFGGVTQIEVIDNLKAGVKSPCFYDPELNPTFHAMANHYGLAVIPARIRKPKDKAKVEIGIKAVEQTILAALRKRTFFSIQQLNQAIREILEELNNREMKHLGKSRKQLFQLLDQPNLKPLPQKPYEYADYKLARVGIDYHVRYDHNYYSVPYQHVHRKVEVRGTEKIIEIFYKGNRIASHLRSYEKNENITVKEHMPQSHQFMVEWRPKRFIRWAEKIGPNTVTLIQRVLGEKEHPQQSFRKCLGILNLAKRYSDERLEAAAQRALHYNLLSYKKIKNILDKGYEKINPKEENKLNDLIQTTLFHQNIRGDKYYKKEVKEIC